MTKRSESTLAQEALPAEIADALAQALIPLAPAHPEAIKAQVFKRIRAANDSYITVRANEGKWHVFAPKVERKVVFAEGKSEAYFLRLHAGARLPAHSHAEDELCIVLEGSVRLGSFNFGVGDFHIARAGSAHGEVESVHGALLFIRTAPATHVGA